MTGRATDHGSRAEELTRFRRRNWTAIGVGTLIVFVASVAYATAFVDEDGRAEEVDFTLVGVGLAIVPFVFLAAAFISQNPVAPKRVLQAMILFLAVALSVGLLEPVLGAAIGFAAGGALTLRPPPAGRVAAWRTAAVFFTGAYLLVLLVLIPPGGVFAASVVPLVMIGAADEYALYTAGY
jgi:hypothetical protein